MTDWADPRYANRSYDDEGYDRGGLNASGYNREEKNWFGRQALLNSPTPSGGNFGDTVTGEQDIYNTDISSDPWFQDSANRELPGPDPSLFTVNPGGGGGGGGSSWDQYESEVAKMGKPSTNMGGSPSGGSGGSSGMTLQQARNQTMGIQQYNWEEQQKILDKQWNDRFEKTNAASNTEWADRFAKTNAQWAEQAKTTQTLNQQTWDKQYETMQKDWDAKFGKTNEAERAKWAEQFAAANTEWERRYNIEKNKTTTTRVVGPTGPMPTAGEMPTFAAPERDQGRIKELTQQKSAAGLREMRAQIQKAMGQGYRNANVKRMTLRDALAGYGQGIENVMTGAQTAAGSEYNTEYASKYDTAGKNWQTAYQTKMQDWQNKVNDYFKNYGTVTTTS